MTAAEAVRRATEILADSVESPSSEAERLLMHVLRSDRVGLYLAGGSLPVEAVEMLQRLVDERKKGTPLQYLTGTQAFRGSDLKVGPGVLVPRPETEQLVTRALELIEGVRSPIVLEVGTGSGAIAISIASERTDAVVVASEISGSALVWAEANAADASLDNLTLVRGDLFEPFDREYRDRVDLVVANPPYLTREEIEGAPREVRDHEPYIALLAGSTGTELPMRIVREARAWLRPGGYLLMEVSELRAERIASEMAPLYERVQVGRDLTDRQRFLEGAKTSQSS